jgi:hypothetical protein
MEEIKNVSSKHQRMHYCSRRHPSECIIAAADIGLVLLAVGTEPSCILRLCLSRFR